MLIYCQFSHGATTKKKEKNSKIYHNIRELVGAGVDLRLRRALCAATAAGNSQLVLPGACQGEGSVAQRAHPQRERWTFQGPRQTDRHGT